mgnify:CR=1 FL=1
MIVDSPKLTLSQNTKTQSTAFTIELNATTFEILSRDLYKNPIKAIVRELCCNAIDSHKRAGNDAPFDIHLPTIEEPYLTVQDYGTGLSCEGMGFLYTGYFKSDKRGTNDEIGGKGLGSKTPLAYTDTFSVVSCYNGKKHAYAVHKNAEGLPTLTHIYSVPTDEPNGLNVTLAVAEKDIYKFITEAKNILPWMPYRISNMLLSTTIHKPTALFATGSFKLLNLENCPVPRGTAHILMGNVIYPIDINPMHYDYKKDRVLEGTGLVIELPIGSIDVTAGRDELLYSEKTLTALKEQLNQAYEWIIHTIEQEVGKQPSLFYAQKRLADINNRLCNYTAGLNGLTLQYYDKTTGTRSPVSLAITPRAKLTGLVYKIQRRRKSFTVRKTDCLFYEEGITLCHSTNPVTKTAILRDGDFSDKTYLLVSNDEDEINAFYTLADAKTNDVSFLFPPKEKGARSKPVQQPKTYKVLDFKTEICMSGTPPDDALIIEKEGIEYILAPNIRFSKGTSYEHLGYLRATIPNLPNLVVVSKTTPKYGIPKNGKYLKDMLRNTLWAKYKGMTEEQALTHLALEKLNTIGYLSHNLPYNQYLLQDLRILTAWKLKVPNPLTLDNSKIHTAITKLLNTIKVPK